jgi:competence protein ComEC
MSRVQKTILVILAALAGAVWYVVLSMPPEVLTIYFFDVGQGDSALVISPDGTQILIDGGPDDTVLRRLGEVMPFYDRSLDAIILTHPHADHVNGLVKVLERYEVGMVVESGASYASSAYEEWERRIKDKHIPHVIAVSGQRLIAGGDLRLDMIAPLESFDGVSRKNVHDAMVVAKLVYGETSVLFTGDMEDDLERKLVYFGAPLDADILKVGHHGSKTSSAEGFLRAVSPEAAVISSGEKNRYGHPHEDVLIRLKQFGVFLHRTDEEGTVVLTADAFGAYAFQEKQ